MDEDCPINGTFHRFFINKTYEVFDKVHVNDQPFTVDGVQMYRRRELAILGCNCGAVVRQEVKG